MNDIVRCKYCAGDWYTHDATQRRFCNARLNKITNIAATVKDAMTSETPNVSAPVPWKHQVDKVRQYNTVQVEDYS